MSGAHAAEPRGSGGPLRLPGIDLARCLAVVTMMAAHLVPETVEDGSGGLVVHPVHTVVDGRSAALFAVLAGVSLALSNGRRRPTTQWRRATVSVWARGTVLLVIGMTLGVFSEYVAVILVNYAVLFLVAPLFLRLRTRSLLALAAGWVLLSPVVSHVLRQWWWPEGHWPGDVTSWLSLAEPLGLLHELLLTGYYPVLTWVAYLLVGLAIGRSAVLYQGRGGSLLLLGSGIALSAWVVSGVLLRLPGAADMLVVPEGHPFAYEPEYLIPHLAAYGTAPTSTWWWLATMQPHSGTILDLTHTIGTSVAAIGLCQLLTSVAVARRLLTPLVAAGSMPLTLYTVHVVWVALNPEPENPVPYWLVQAAILVLVAWAYRVLMDRARLDSRGPLELLMAKASTAAAGRFPAAT